MIEITKQFLLVINEYAKASNFEVTHSVELPDNLLVNELIACYRKYFKYDKVLKKLVHVTEEDLENGIESDIVILIYVTKNDYFKMSISICNTNINLFISKELNSFTIMTAKYDIIKTNIDDLINYYNTTIRL